MAFLFEVENNVAKPTEEALLIEPFKTIWEKDKSKDKTEAIKKFTFIELFTSKKKTNPYAGYKDEDRAAKLKEMLWKNPNKKLDKLTIQGVEKLKEFQTKASPSYSFYEAALEAARKTEDFFRTFDYHKTDKYGKPIYNPNFIVSAVEKTSRVLSALQDMREKVEAELFKADKFKGDEDINPLEE